MIKLYGFPISNYYNMVKMTLLEKGMAFEEVMVRPSQEADYLSCSPTGESTMPGNRARFSDRN